MKGWLPAEGLGGQESRVGFCTIRTRTVLPPLPPGPQRRAGATRHFRLPAALASPAGGGPGGLPDHPPVSHDSGTPQASEAPQVPLAGPNTEVHWP